MWVRAQQCERARELASRRVDGELSEVEEALLRTHQTSCHECRAFALGIRAFTRALRAAPAERPGRSVQLPRRQRPALRSFQVAAVAAAVAVVAGVGSTVALLGSPSTSHVPHATPSARNGDLAEVRRIRRNELAFTSAIIAQRANDERILRLS